MTIPAVTTVETPEELGERILERIDRLKITLSVNEAFVKMVGIDPNIDTPQGQIRKNIAAFQTQADTMNEIASLYRALAAWQRRYNQKGGV